MRVVIDLETRSEVDLKKAGVTVYAKHPSTEVLCVAYKIDNKKTKIWWPVLGEDTPDDFFEAVYEGAELVAHNVSFEWSIFEYCYREKYDVFLPHLPIQDWRCTAAKAAVHALPRKLADACEALKLKVQKDKDGHKIMLKMSKPRSAWVKKGTGDKYFWKKEEVEKLGRYCMTDVDAEAELDDALPDLIPSEAEVFRFDHLINKRGVKVDLPLVKKILRMIKEESIILHEEFRELTNDKVKSPAQVKELLALLHDDLDVYLENLKAPTVVEALLNPDLDPTARRLLEIRQALSKTSTAKYKAFLNMVSKDDHRLRDTLLYSGASTGRWSGRGVQLQNLPKGKIKNTELASSVIEVGDFDFVKVCYPNASELFSSCIRSMLTASPGHNLYAGDFAAIEARVLFWVADYEAGLKMFRENVDLYVKEASDIYNKEERNILDGERQLGKVAILGLGYGMGEKKFLDTCHAWGIKNITPEIAKKAVKNYRKKHRLIPQLWAHVEQAAIAATLNHGETFTINKTEWTHNGKFLYCKLPSGRSIAFYGAEVKKGKTPWGDIRPVLYHWGVNSTTKKWEFTKTYGGKLVENICQGIARDLMAFSMIKTEKKGYATLLTVHDEVVSEHEEGSVEDFERLMSKTPKWAKGCPVVSKAWKGFRYKK
jgi:DNA polymerase